MFKHNICGNQLELSNYMPDSPNFLAPECFASLRFPPVSASSKDAAAGVRCGEVVVEPGRGAPLEDLNGT